MRSKTKMISGSITSSKSRKGMCYVAAVMVSCAHNEEILTLFNLSVKGTLVQAGQRTVSAFFIRCQSKQQVNV